MLSRVLGALLHPFIYLAYGLEFDILGQVAQGLAQTAIHEANPTGLILPSYFINSVTDTELSNPMHRLKIAGSGTSAPAPEKRPTFAFHRRIQDYPTFAVELLSSPLLQYEAVVKSAGGAIHDLVQEWTEEWLAGVGVHGGVDAEARLRGMVEEVVWGNVIWYGIGGWASRGTGGRGFNADFFMCAVLLSPRPSSCHRSSSMGASLRRALPGSRSPIASCCSRHTSPCPRRGTSCAAATTACCPLRSSMQLQTRSYMLLQELRV